MKTTKAQKILQTKFVESTMRNSEPNILIHAIPCVTLEEDDRGEEGLSQKERKRAIRTALCWSSSKTKSTATNKILAGNVTKSLKQQSYLLNVSVESRLLLM